VDVLTARNAPAVSRDESLLQQVPSEVSIHRCWTLDLPFALRKGIKKFVASHAKEVPPLHSSEKQTSRQAKPGLLKRILGNMLLPDPQIGWLPFALPAAVRLIRKHRFDLVLVTVPPFSCVRLVTKLRSRFPLLPIILDFRDEWLSTTIKLVSFNSNERARRIAYKAEAEAVHSATAIVMVTPAAQIALEKRYPDESPSKFHCIPNGFDTVPSTSLAVAPSQAERVVLTFIGSVYGSTDPSTFVEAVRTLPLPIRERILVRFIGHIETPAYRQKLMSLGETIELKGFLPQAEALRAIADTTYLLLISHDPINVAAKLYDYMGGGKPILAAVHPDGDVRRLLEETGGGWWANAQEIDSIRHLLIQAVERAGTLDQTFNPHKDIIAGYHRRPLTRRYAELMRSVVLEQQSLRGVSPS
jgi:hypothetical protein